jgi:isoleucyl-tRNA synthetase
MEYTFGLAMTTEPAQAAPPGKPNYKSTLNLPKTDFAMKANLSQNEPQSLKRWDEARLYDAVTAAREHAQSQPFVFHDGPPYANGSIHVGHLLNKVLKDIVVRSQLMMGKQCRYVPGWDCHGLPIEHKVVTEMVESGKSAKIDALPDDQRRMAIRRECAKYAEKYIKLQAGQMKRLLTLADYDHPYLTMAKEYEQKVLEAFADLIEQGIVYRALKPVHWSIANQTALAEAELEYEDREDPSIYVDFEAADREAVARAFGMDVDAEVGGLEQTPSFMIWTTTPWTLPANLAIAVHPRFKYALVRMDGNITIIARDLVDKVAKIGKTEEVEVLAETDGAQLVGLRYAHPFVTGKPRLTTEGRKTGVGAADANDDRWRIVPAEYVTLEDGTGLVHTAPGHGAEDYATGLREGLPIYCPVRDDGTFDETAPEFVRGKSVWDANPIIINHLRESGHLFHSHMFTHSYPHDWRSRTPVIFRATQQWFIGVDAKLNKHDRSLRAMALQAAEKDVAFYPDWGRNRLRGMLESRPDWCISRQRAWGLPIPAFQLEDGSMLLTAASVRAVAKVVGQRGSDAWFLETPEKLLEHYDAAGDPDAPPALGGGRQTGLSPSAAASVQKTYDILDVWFESGSSWNAVIRPPQRDLGYPADLYLEGSDQHRGWFQASLLSSVGATGQAPFKALLTHGFIVDKDGRKMSKSLGNTIEVEDLLKSFGADVCRWWVSSLAFENDIKMDVAFFQTAGAGYVKMRNTLRFLLSNLYDFSASQVDVKSIAQTSIDGYILQRASELQKQVIDAYAQYEFRIVHQLLFDFCNDTLSKFYCAAAKDRLYCDRPDSPRRRATQSVMWTLMETLCRLLAPIMPHTADEAYRALWKGTSERNLFLESVQPIEFAADSDWAKAMAAREMAQKALEEAKARGIENPLDAEVVVPDPEGVLQKFAADWPDMLGVSRVRFTASGEVTVNDLRDEPRCDRSWKRDGTVKQRRDGGMLSDRDAEAVGVM